MQQSYSIIIFSLQVIYNQQFLHKNVQKFQLYWQKIHELSSLAIDYPGLQAEIALNSSAVLLLQPPFEGLPYYFIMPNKLTICHKVQLKTQKDLELFKRRQMHHIQGTPKIALGGYETHMLIVWAENLKKDCLTQLKELNSNQQAFNAARIIIQACLQLAPVYGFFIINENMVFIKEDQSVTVWINPNPLENHVKIYLPPTPQGEKAMIRSIVSFLKLWLRCDFLELSEAKHLQQLPFRLRPCRVKFLEDFNPKSPRKVQAERRNSMNIYEAKFKRRFQTSKLAPSGSKLQQNFSIRCKKVRTRSPEIQSDSTLRLTNLILPRGHTTTMKKTDRSNQFLKNNGTTLVSQKYERTTQSFQPRPFTNTIHFNHTKTTFKESLSGLSSYFPNKTTANKNHIVRMILEFDNDPNFFGKNNILLDEQKLRDLERQKLRKLKQSLHGIGEELNDLFQSNFFEGQDFTIKDISKEFEHLLE